MNLDELRTVQSKERQKDSLQNLRPSFYQEVGEYIADLEDERERVAAQADDPFSSPEVGRLTDEIETAKDVVEAIYERRMGKLVKQASLAAAGMPADDEGLTAEEADLFEDLVDRISSNKTRVLDVLEGVAAESDEETGSAGEAVDSSSPTEPGGPSEAPPDRTQPDDTPPAPPMESPSDADPTDAGGTDTAATDSDGVTPADVMGGSGPTVDSDSTGGQDEPNPEEPSRDPTGLEREDSSGELDTEQDADERATAVTDAEDDSGPAENTVDRVTVKITRDIGSILGVDDREYTLAANDVVTLPEQNASPLLERGAAEQLE